MAGSIGGEVVLGQFAPFGSFRDQRVARWEEVEGLRDVACRCDGGETSFDDGVEG